MLAKLIAVLSIMLILTFHNLPAHPGEFLGRVNKDVAAQELTIQSLELEKQIISWYHCHNDSFPPDTTTHTLSSSILRQMGIDPALGQKIYYTCDNTKGSFVLLIQYADSSWHQSPHSNQAIR